VSINKLFATLLGATSLLSAASSAFAQNSTSPPPGFPPFSSVTVPPGKPAQPPRSDLAKRLDALQAANDINGLASTLLSAPAQERMIWLTDAVHSGGSSMLSIALVNDLWSAGLALKQTEPAAADGALRTAGITWLYTYQIMIIDSGRCADATAPDARRNNFLSSFRPVFTYLKSQPETVKASALDRALRLEAITAEKRGDDHYLCSGGLAQMNATLKDTGGANKTVGDLIKESGQVPKSNSLGTVVQLPAPKSFVPSFVGKDVIAAKQADLRASMRAGLLEMLK
jgi:hypothetical protein